TRMASAAWHYAMSMNRAWLELWSNRLSEYTELPKRLLDVQTGFMEHAFDHYRESLQQLGGLASQAQHEAEGMMRGFEEAGERAGQELRQDAKDAAKGGRPKEFRPQSASQNQREHQRGSH